MRKFWLLSVPLSLLVGIAIGICSGQARAQETASFVPTGIPSWQKASTEMVQNRGRIINDLIEVVGSLDLRERQSAIITPDDKSGRDAVEAIHLLGQLRAEESVDTLVKYLDVKVSTVESKPVTLFNTYPAAGALTEIGVASLERLLLPYPSQVAALSNPALETHLIGAVILRVLGRRAGIAYAEERLARVKPGKARTRIESIIRYVKTHNGEPRNLE